MAIGDGEIVRVVLDAMVAFLRGFASPTGARGSVLLMTGGLVVLGFLFLAFLFRSAIVGDLAPIANANRPLARALLPPRWSPGAAPAAASGDEFSRARALARKAHPTLDGVFALLAKEGAQVRVMQSGATRKLVRVYASALPCERVRGLLAGGFESLTGELAKVDEVHCRAMGSSCCEFDVRHAVVLRMIP